MYYPLASVVGRADPKCSLSYPPYPASSALCSDTVNLASRMESHGLPNLVHLSKAAADLLREQVKRGERI